jgi:hypothetical protein
MAEAAKLESQLELEAPESDPRTVARQRHAERAIEAGIRPPTGRRVLRPPPARLRPRIVALFHRLLRRLLRGR